jgi:hypothetical protein
MQSKPRSNSINEDDAIVASDLGYSTTTHEDLARSWVEVARLGMGENKY